MKFRISQDCDYANGYLRYGHLEGVVEVKNREELEKIIKEKPESLRDYMEFELDDYNLNDYDVGDNPIIIEGEIKNE